VKARSAAATPGPIRQLDDDDPLMLGDDAFTVRLQVYGLRRLADGAFYARARTDVDRLVAMVEAARKLSRGIAAEYADMTQGPSETLGKIAMRAEEYDAELDRIAGEGTK
jgi:hypothetical protein